MSKFSWEYINKLVLNNKRNLVGEEIELTKVLSDNDVKLQFNFPNKGMSVSEKGVFIIDDNISHIWHGKQMMCCTRSMTVTLINQEIFD